MTVGSASAGQSVTAITSRSHIFECVVSEPETSRPHGKSHLENTDFELVSADRHSASPTAILQKRFHTH